MENKQKFGAGIWHFATYVDRYATDGYGPERDLLEMIDLAGTGRLGLSFPGGSQNTMEIKY